MKDIIIVGAGFSGLYMLHSMRQSGYSVQLFEAAKDVGGTWYWNRYPGARCDVESLDYQFAFSDAIQRGWSWKEKYATQPELLSYLQYVAKSLDLRKDIYFETRVTRAYFQTNKGTWRIETDQDDNLEAKYLIAATGCLSAIRIPPFKGLEKFSGNCFHTGNWPDKPVNFKDRHVGLIGTGSSGIQSIPIIAKEAESLTVFQRSPSFSVPAHNKDHPKSFVEEYKDEFLKVREAATKTDFGNSTWSSFPSALQVSEKERASIYEENWKKGGARFMVAFEDMLTDPEANKTAADFLRDKIRSIVKDKLTAEMLLPYDHPVGTKRLCVDTDYYETFNRENVNLVNVRDNPIVEITDNGLRTADKAYTFDTLILATGFDTMTGALDKIDIRGRHGKKLSEKWADGPTTYLGISASEFPNFFIITGPGSPSVLSNMALSIEQHVKWITNCINWVEQQGGKTIEALAESEKNWVQHVNEVADTTLFPLANSWYMGANIPGKPRVFAPYVGGVGTYHEKCDEVARDGYPGFAITTR